MTFVTSLMSRTWRSFSDLLVWVVFEAHIESIELWTSLNALIWGAWLLNPWMDVFSTLNIYSTMRVIPEWMWGAMALVAGTLQLAGRLKGKPMLIRIGARTLAAMWMFGAAAIAWQNWRLASIITYPMMASASLLVSYRAIAHTVRRTPHAVGGPHDGGTC